MKKTFFLLSATIALCVNTSFAANTVRPSMSGRMMSAPRAGVASKNQISAAAMQTSESSASIKAGDVNANPEIAPEQTVSVKKDMREKERNACINNNIGVGNTFVWASRYSDTSNYASMVEDIEEPENNTCFVKAALKSNDARVRVDDVPAKYFEMGQIVTCGEWANYDSIKQRILDAKKKGRALGTVASVVAGAGIGVGAMELFGNKLIGGKVEGQFNENLTDAQLLISQLSVLKKDNPTEYEKFITELKELKTECNSYKDNYATENEDDMPESCKKYNDVFSLLETPAK